MLREKDIHVIGRWVMREEMDLFILLMLADVLQFNLVPYETDKLGNNW